MDESEYEAVLWDIGGVIVELKSIREGYVAFIAEIATMTDFDPQSALETWKSVLGDHFSSRDGAEYVTARDGYRKATNALFEEPPDETAWMETFRRTSEAAMRPEQYAIETIQALDDAGLYLGIVSDIDTADAESMLSTFGVTDAFDAMTTSEDVGYTKPDSRMFADAIKKLRASDIGPDKTLMIGDRYRHDVEGAAEAGLTSVAYGQDASGPVAAYEIVDLREVLSIAGLTADIDDLAD
jgi:putative hydrolase of the HAD superfamily